MLHCVIAARCRVAPAARKLKPKSAAHSVSLNDSCIELVRVTSPKAVDGLARNASSLSDLLDLLVSGDANLSRVVGRPTSRQKS